MSTTNYAQRLEIAREEAGKSVEEMATLINMSKASYYDLESYDDELITSVSLSQVVLLFKGLNLKPRKFFDNELPDSSTSLSIKDLIARVELYLDTHQMAVSTFEDLAGWGIETRLKNPERFLDYNLCALMDICNVIGIDWLEVFSGIMEEKS